MCNFFSEDFVLLPVLPREAASQEKMLLRLNGGIMVAVSQKIKKKKSQRSQ